MLRRLLKGVLPVLLAFAMVIAPFTSVVNADGSYRLVKYAKNVTVICFNDNANPYYQMVFGRLGKGAKSVKAVSSKRGVITELENEGDSLSFKANKPGQTVLTIKIKYRNGSAKKLKVNVTALKYTSPIKSLKIGGRNYLTKALIRKMTGDFSVKGKYAKVSVVPKTGWTVTKLSYWAEYEGDKEDVDDIDKDYRNNSKIKFKNNDDYNETVQVTLKNRASGMIVDYWLELDN